MWTSVRVDNGSSNNVLAGKYLSILETALLLNAVYSTISFLPLRLFTFSEWQLALNFDKPLSGKCRGRGDTSSPCLKHIVGQRSYLISLIVLRCYKPTHVWSLAILCSATGIRIYRLFNRYCCTCVIINTLSLIFHLPSDICVAWVPIP